MNITLSKLDKTLRFFLSAYIITLTIGVAIGLIYVRTTTNMSAQGTIERYNGNDEGEIDFEMQVNYAKSISELLMTTHNHIFGFSFIFLSIGMIFYFNSIIEGFWKKFLMVEPLISAVVTFGSIWGMRFIHENFVYLIFISATLLYLSYFAMAGISFYELVFKSDSRN